VGGQDILDPKKVEIDEYPDRAVVLKPAEIINKF